MPYCQSRFAILPPLLAISIALAGLDGRNTTQAQPPQGGQTAGGPQSPSAGGFGNTPGAGNLNGPSNSTTSREEALAAVPMNRLTPTAQKRIQAITSRPTLYRHLGQQSIECDTDLFLCVVRNPEILVGIWDLMEITTVKTQRLDAFQLRAIDGSGTDCTVDLVYGDPAIHVYVADGFYDGKLTAGVVPGKGVFILRSRYSVDASGNSVVDGTLDCFVQVDHLAADLIIRTFGPLIGRTADNNFAETAKFIDQLGTTARRNPAALEELALRLPQVSDPTRQRFATLIRQSAERHHSRVGTVPVSARNQVIQP
jgi:hypothetical protein